MQYVFALLENMLLGNKIPLKHNGQIEVLWRASLKKTSWSGFIQKEPISDQTASLTCLIDYSGLISIKRRHPHTYVGYERHHRWDKPDLNKQSSCNVKVHHVNTLMWSANGPRSWKCVASCFLHSRVSRETVQRKHFCGQSAPFEQERWMRRVIQQQQR